MSFPMRGLRSDVAELAARLDGAKAVYVCNPNNPTGRMVNRSDLLDLVAEAARKETLVFLDETLLELSSRSDELSLVPEVESHENLFIIRSFTKSFAMPGLRIGYVFGPRRLLNYLEAGRLTWNLGTIEQRVATRLMEEEQEHVARAATMIEGEKRRMHARAEKLMGRVPMPDSYFFFAPLDALDASSAEFRRHMLRHGVWCATAPLVRRRVLQLHALLRQDPGEERRVPRRLLGPWLTFPKDGLSWSCCRMPSPYQCWRC